LGNNVPKVPLKLKDQLGMRELILERISSAENATMKDLTPLIFKN
jgi:hypothetical protein